MIKTELKSDIFDSGHSTYIVPDLIKSDSFHVEENGLISRTIKGMEKLDKDLYVLYYLAADVAFAPEKVREIKVVTFDKKGDAVMSITHRIGSVIDAAHYYRLEITDADSAGVAVMCVWYRLRDRESKIHTKNYEKTEEASSKKEPTKSVSRGLIWDADIDDVFTFEIKTSESSKICTFVNDSPLTRYMGKEITFGVSASWFKELDNQVAALFGEEARFKLKVVYHETLGRTWEFVSIETLGERQ